jgi:short-subunit dehydrogenase
LNLKRFSHVFFGFLGMLVQGFLEIGRQNFDFEAQHRFMDKYFKDKVIWVTGASSGIGEALVHALAKEDCWLIISARREAVLLEVAKAAGLKQGKYLVLPLDLAESEKAAEWVRQALAFKGRVDVMIHNGGISQRAFALGTDLEVDRRLMEVNYFGTVALSKALLPSMVARKSGHFVVVSSLVGKFGTPKRSGYAASKHALHGFFDSLRAELHDQGIRVTMILPGFVNTPLPTVALTSDGSPQGHMDPATESGMAPNIFARKMLRAIAKQKREKAIGGWELRGLVMSRFFPGILAKVLRKAKVT